MLAIAIDYLCLAASRIVLQHACVQANSQVN